MSKSAIGGILLIIITVLNLFGIEIPEGTLENAVEALSTIIGIVMLVWGQLARKDLKFGIIRK